MERKINDVLDKIRPFLISEGGDVEFVKYEDGKCYLKFIGACQECPYSDITFDDGVRELLINEIPEIIDVILVN